MRWFCWDRSDLHFRHAELLHRQVSILPASELAVRWRASHWAVSIWNLLLSICGSVLAALFSEQPQKPICPSDARLVRKGEVCSSAATVSGLGAELVLCIESVREQWGQSCNASWDPFWKPAYKPHGGRAPPLLTWPALHRAHRGKRRSSMGSTVQHCHFVGAQLERIRHLSLLVLMRIWAVGYEACLAGIAQAVSTQILYFKEKPSYAVISHNLFSAARQYMSRDFLVLI